MRMTLRTMRAPACAARVCIHARQFRRRGVVFRHAVTSCIKACRVVAIFVKVAVFVKAVAVTAVALKSRGAFDSG
jgi:hypothetical protein